MIFNQVTNRGNVRKGPTSIPKHADVRGRGNVGNHFTIFDFQISFLVKFLQNIIYIYILH